MVLISVDFKCPLVLTYINVNKNDKEMAQNKVSYCKVIIIIANVIMQSLAFQYDMVSDP